MKTKDAIDLAGSAAALARLLNITQGAICQWSENVPDLRVYELKELRPKWFRKKTTVQVQPAQTAHAA